MSDDYANASDNLAQAIGQAAGHGTSGYHYRTEHLTVDQRIEVAKVQALLAIAAELSMIQDQGINPEWEQRHH